jgi:hypothetical protein
MCGWASLRRCWGGAFFWPKTTIPLILEPPSPKKTTLMAPKRKHLPSIQARIKNEILKYQQKML